MFWFNRFSANLICRQFTIQYRALESLSSTIYALSTNIKNTGSAIAVVRVAGPCTLEVINKITDGKASYYQKNPRKAILQNLYTVDNLDIIDKAMLIWFPKPKSYTGEDMCEFHIHGSQAVIAKLLTTLGQIDGCRAAKEGEFTKKALMNGKLQLIEAEGIRDLIHAKTDAQRRRAMSVITEYGLESKFNDWREQIINYMAHLDAYIDFSEDELLHEDVMNNLKKNLNLLIQQIEQHLNKSKQRSDLIKDGIRIAIVGEANVGKSSLINKLCERDVSIVSDTSGTTRDVVESWLDINGYSVCIADTAGIKNLNDTTIDHVEREGIKRAIDRAKQCHLIVFVMNALNLTDGKLNLPNYLQELIQHRNEDNLIYVVNKIDLFEEKQPLPLLVKQNSNIYFLSCRNGDGFSPFFNSFGRKIEELCGNPNDEILFNNERHLTHFEKTIHELAQVISLIDVDFALAASHLRQAAYQLECLTGKITTDDILDVIFKDFCIGK